MLHPSTRKLIDRLAEMTELGKLDWTEGDDNSIVYATEGYCVCLPDGANEIVINSKDGKELERASADELSATQTESGTPYAEIVAGMAAEATRVARGTEAAISSLLAGMDDPAPAEVSEATDDVITEPEDPGDEMAALADSVLPTVETPPAPETEVETEVETEPTADLSEPTDAPEAEETEDAAAEAVEIAAETPSNSEDETEAMSSVDDDAASEDSETDVTEAVARMADEVNNRPDQESEVDVAAAMAVGAVASAAGLDHANDADQTETGEKEEAPFAVAATEATEPPAYVPFGLEDDGEPVLADNDASDIVAIDSASAPAEPHDALHDSSESSDPVFVAMPQETEETSSTDNIEPMSVVTSEVPESAAEPEVDNDLSGERAPSSDDEAEIVDIAHLATTPSESSDETVEAAAAPDEEPEQPQSYSLSGIGAGFGLGALSARTEASGIPGPSSPANAEAEKIVIDATEDVLPEIEGKLNLPPLETTSSDDNVRSLESPESEADSEADESDGDILKPRTRFNPWD